MTVCQKFEIAFGPDEKANKLFVLAADAIRKVVNNSCRKCALLSSQMPLAHVWTDIRFRNAPACRSLVYLVFQKQLKTNSFRRPGPARNRCASGLESDLCFGGRSRERSVLDRFCSESIKKLSPFDQGNRIDVRRAPNSDVFRSGPKRRF